MRRFSSAVEVRALDTDDGAFVLQSHVSSGLDLHVLEVPLDLSRPHAGADDVDEGEHVRLLGTDDAGFEVFEVALSGGARVGHRGDANPQSEAIRLETPEAIGVGVLRQAGVHLNVDIDQARCHV